MIVLVLIAILAIAALVIFFLFKSNHKLKKENKQISQGLETAVTNQKQHQAQITQTEQQHQAHSEQLAQAQGLNKIDQLAAINQQHRHNREK